VYRWIEDGVAYWAISDVASTELGKFAELFRDTPGSMTCAWLASGADIQITHRHVHDLRSPSIRVDAPGTAIDFSPGRHIGHRRYPQFLNQKISAVVSPSSGSSSAEFFGCTRE
jgi:hypothetical protein